ncbi:MAG: GHMP kinase [Parcubacteria group bacterium GW2011_GWA2_47_12]|nr:MAG: GHMP kinase [Parcubacteria group bacterium GW2011_GWA2_47_12]
MVITKTPFRISFFGGGTDYPRWYRKNGGAVLSATIDKYCHIVCRHLPNFFDHNFLIRYARTEMVKRVQDIKHPSVRACLQFLGHTSGVEIVHTGDLPARSGLGSSSTFTVGLLHALYALRGEVISKHRLARDAIHIEQNLIGETVGSQDQTAAAFGGFNHITFGGPSDILVESIPLSQSALIQLEKNLMLFFTGVSRTASVIAEDQLKRIGKKADEYLRMLQLVYEAHALLSGAELDCRAFGMLLHEAWLVKKRFSSRISSPLVDDIYAAAREAGAIGGKVLGAGGGGFMLFCVPLARQDAVKKRLRKFMHVPFHFEHLGSHIINNTPSSL